MVCPLSLRRLASATLVITLFVCVDITLIYSSRACKYRMRASIVQVADRKNI